MKLDKPWRKTTADEYAAMFPARPKALRKIARGLRKAGLWQQPRTMCEAELANLCGVSVRTLARYLPVFENYGVIEVKRWRYRFFGTVSNTYLLHFGSVIPEDWTFGGGPYPVSPREIGYEQAA